MKTTLAYLAGIVDGEGYIGIKKSQRKDCVSPSFQERIQVRMTKPEAIRLLACTLGGTYYRERKPQVAGRRRLYLWTASDRTARSIMNALTVIMLRDSKYCAAAMTSRTIPRHVIAHRERLYRECKRLNGRAA
jgi:hypothetical protein